MVLLLVLSFLGCAGEPHEVEPTSEGDYLGETPPGLTPVPFAGGELVEHPRGEKRSFNLAFSPEGDELFFSYYKGTEEKPLPEYEIKTFRRVDGLWTGPETASFSGTYSDVDINFSPDGDHLFFASNRRQPDSPQLEIYSMERTRDGWSEPVHAGDEVNSGEGEVYPSLSERGNLFFRSSRPGGYGGSDLYRAEWVDGRFTNVRNLGPEVNSEYGQSNCVISRDESYIVFVTYRPEREDEPLIFVSFQTGENLWTEAVSVGDEVNAPGGAGAPTLSPDGKYLFFKKRVEPDRGLWWVSTEVIERHRPEARAETPADDFASRLVGAAMERLSHAVRYDGSYRAIDYPNGDVPDHVGVCTDVVIRSYRVLGIDLQQVVHEDMMSAFDEYPDKWGLTRPDSNIDHRRVPNLEVFFERHGETLPVTRDADDYRPGDLVTWMLPGDLPHIGIVVEGRSRDGRRPLIVHNIGAGPRLEDVLFDFPITGHFRYDGSVRPSPPASAQP